MLLIGWNVLRGTALSMTRQRGWKREIMVPRTMATIHDPFDRVGPAEPSNFQDGSGAVYTLLSVQSPLLPPKGGPDKALHSSKVFGVVIRRKADFQAACEANSSQS